jgi:NAD(P)-dependent dehydrogenase (short-subunit alcohol dehydrogenase family)
MKKNADLKGKVALITGSARRIGKAIALALADSGMSVIIHYHQSRREAEQLRKQILAKGVQAWTIQADLSRSQQVARLLTRCRKKNGKIHFLINNASVFEKDELLNIKEKNLFNTYQVNVISPLVLSQQFSKLPEAEHIVNLLDTRIHSFDFHHASYDLSKKTLHALTRGLAIELAPRLQVNAVAPGLIMPPAGENLSYLEKYKKTNPLESFGSSEEIARAVVFLLSNPFITGQVIYIDGGRHLKGIHRGQNFD